MPDSNSPVHQNPEFELDDDDSTRFNKSLQGLKDLCFQLHHAADYCETSFLNAEHAQKKVMVENTKGYLRGAMITVVDHLGSVSANLDYRLSKYNAVSETEFKINCLEQRLVTCQKYGHNLALTRVSWSSDFPRHHSCYKFPPMPDLERSKEVSRKCRTPIAAKTFGKHEFEIDEEVPLFLYTSSHRPSLALTKDSSTNTDDQNSASVLPVRDGLSGLPKTPNPSFHFEGNHKLKRNMLSWKLVQNNDILSLVRKSKRAT